MKKQNVVFGALISMALAGSISAAFAAEGGHSGGGGDICEDRIKVIRDDLKSWIHKGGAQGLALSSGMSIDQYSSLMSDQIKSAQIKCVGSSDIDYPVTINGTPKVCKFSSSAKGAQITCDYVKFLATSESDQYVLIHHEYAGLAGIEVPNKDDSHYEISNQISGYLEDRVMKRLAVKAGPADIAASLTEIARNEDGSVRRMTQYDADRYCRHQGQRLPTVRELALYAQSLGAQGISEKQKDGYYFVRGMDSLGNPDNFYFSDKGFQSNSEEDSFLLWSSSIDLGGISNSTDDAYSLNGWNGMITWGDIRYNAKYSATRCVRTR